MSASIFYEKYFIIGPCFTYSMLRFIAHELIKMDFLMIFIDSWHSRRRGRVFASQTIFEPPLFRRDNRVPLSITLTFEMVLYVCIRRNRCTCIVRNRHITYHYRVRVQPANRRETGNIINM